MWTLQRLCKVEVVLLSVMTFFFGVSLNYFTLYYVGYGVDKCRESPTLYFYDKEQWRWPRNSDQEALPTPEPFSLYKKPSNGGMLARECVWSNLQRF